MEEAMHVGIEQPIQKRKEILSLAIYAIEALKGVEMGRKMNKEKEIYKKNFIQVVKEINDGIQEFRDTLPAVQMPRLKEEKKEEVEKPKKEEVTPAAVKKPLKRKTHMDDLEDDLARLRDKIARL